LGNKQPNSIVDKILPIATMGLLMPNPKIEHKDPASLSPTFRTLFAAARIVAIYLLMAI
jgi:hypothetical protein